MITDTDTILATHLPCTTTRQKREVSGRQTRLAAMIRRILCVNTMAARHSTNAESLPRSKTVLFTVEIFVLNWTRVALRSDVKNCKMELTLEAFVRDTCLLNPSPGRYPINENAEMVVRSHTQAWKGRRREVSSAFLASWPGLASSEERGKNLLSSRQTKTIVITPPKGRGALETGRGRKRGAYDSRD